MSRHAWESERIGIAFGEALRQGREREKLSITQLAAELGVGHRTIYRWEAGTSRPELIVYLCKRFDIDLRRLA